jgi:hypothetical protein
MCKICGVAICKSAPYLTTRHRFYFWPQHEAVLCCLYELKRQSCRVSAHMTTFKQHETDHISGRGNLVYMYIDVYSSLIKKPPPSIIEDAMAAVCVEAHFYIWPQKSIISWRGKEPNGKKEKKKTGMRGIDAHRFKNKVDDLCNLSCEDPRFCNTARSSWTGGRA